MPLPNLLIIGAPKTGTTALRKALSLHPDIFFPDTQPIEPHYLCYASENWPHWAIKSRRDYESLFFDHNGQKYTGEKSTWYLYSEGAPRVAASSLVNCVAIALLRDPVARAFSHFTFNRQNGWEPSATFERALAFEAKAVDRTTVPDRMYIEAGKYSDQIKRWYDALGRERVHLMLQEDLYADPVGEVRRLFELLGVSPILDDEAMFPRENVSTGIRSAAIPKLVNRLRGHAGFVPEGIKMKVSRVLRTLNSTKKPRLEERIARELAFEFKADVKDLSELIGKDLEARWLSDYL